MVFQKGNQYAKGNLSNRTSFKKGHIPSNKGTHIQSNNALEIWRKNGGIPANKGKNWTNSGSFQKGHLFYKGGDKGWFKKGFIPWNRNKRGKESHSWKGGISFEPYSTEFNKELKIKIKERDNHICQLCGMTEKEQKRIDSLKRGLCIHHIDYDKKNSNFDNLISLCKKCNSVVNFKKEDWINYFKEKLKNKL